MKRFENTKYDKDVETMHHNELQTVKSVPYWDRNDVGLKVPIDANGKKGQRSLVLNLSARLLISYF